MIFEVLSRWRILIALLALVLSAPAAYSLTCHFHPAVQLFWLLADDPATPTRVIPAAARAAVHGILQDANLLFEGKPAGIECGPTQSRIRYDDVLWLKGPKAGQTEKIVSGIYEHFGSSCIDLPPTPRQLVMARPSQTPSEGADFTTDFCLSWSLAVIELPTSDQQRRRAPHAEAHYAMLKSEFERQIAALRPQPPEPRATCEAFPAFCRR